MGPEQLIGALQNDNGYELSGRRSPIGKRPPLRLIALMSFFLVAIAKRVIDVERAVRTS